MAPMRGDARSYLPDEILLLCRYLKLGAPEVQEWGRVDYLPEKKAEPSVLLTGGVMAGLAAAHKAIWIVKGKPGEKAHLFHWALQVPVGQQRTASEASATEPKTAQDSLSRGVLHRTKESRTALKMQRQVRKSPSRAPALRFKGAGAGSLPPGCGSGNWGPKWPTLHGPLAPGKANHHSLVQ